MASSGLSPVDHDGRNTTPLPAIARATLRLRLPSAPRQPGAPQIFSRSPPEPAPGSLPPPTVPEGMDPLIDATADFWSGFPFVTPGFKFFDNKREVCWESAKRGYLEVSYGPSAEMKTHPNYMMQTLFDSMLAKFKAKDFQDFQALTNNFGLPMNGDAHNKVYDYRDIVWMKQSHLKWQFASNPFSKQLCSKVLAPSYLVGEDEVKIWVLPIERPLGLGTNSSSGFPATSLWYDSGCTRSVVGIADFLVDCRAATNGKTVTTADGSRLRVHAIGTIKMPGIWIPEVYYVPGCVLNLISPQQLAVHHKINSALDAFSCVMWTGPNIELVGEGVRDEREGLYRLTFLLVP